MVQGTFSYLWPRAVIALCLVVIAYYFIDRASVPEEYETTDLFLNIGSEILGIVITVAFIEFYFAWQRRRSEARNIAWRTLYELDQVVWLWQGGYPTFNFDELYGIVQDIQTKDKLAPTTLDTIVRLGNTAEAALAMHGRLANLIPPLEIALEELTVLSDRNRFSRVENLTEDDYAEIKARLKFAVDKLAIAVRENIQNGKERGQVYEGLARDRSPDGQKNRLNGLIYRGGFEPKVAGG